MTTKSELIDLLHFLPDLGRVGAYGRNAMIEADPTGVAAAIGVTTELLTLDGREPTGKFLMIQIIPNNAVNLAVGILAVAKERGWPMPEEYEAISEKDRKTPH